MKLTDDASVVAGLGAVGDHDGLDASDHVLRSSSRLGRSPDAEVVDAWEFREKSE